jgi:hypothetical protein
MGAIQFSSSGPTSTPGVTASTTTVPATPIPASLTPTAVNPTISPEATSTPLIMAPTSTVIPTNIPPTTTQTNVPTVVASATASPIATTQPLLEKTYDDKNSVINYSSHWSDIIKSSAYKGSFKQTSVNGSSIIFKFSGQSFSIIFKGGPSYRKMNVFIDGQLVGVIDQKLATSQYNQRWDYSGQLKSEPHTLKLVFATSSTSTITYGSLDAIIIR